MRWSSTARLAAAVSLAILIPACQDAPTASADGGAETVAIMVAGIGADAAGIVLRLSGVDQLEAAHPSLDVAWAVDDSGATTVAVLGPIAEVHELLFARRRSHAGRLSVQIIEVADEHGTLSVSASARAVVTGGT